MRLVRVGRVVWDVVAITSATGSNVLTELEAIDPGYKHREIMVALIESHVPRNGPPKDNTLRCSPLGNDIFEFKAGPESGKKLRVLWFYDSGERKRIICTHSFLKQTRKTPAVEKKRAVNMRKEYFELKNLGKLPVIEERQ